MDFQSVGLSEVFGLWGLVTAYRPFLDPLSLDAPWLIFCVPMVLAVAVVYKAIKLEDLTDLPRQSIAMAVQVLALMMVAALALWALTEMV